MDDRVPTSLRRYVVDQDYDHYTEIDHEVWRRVIGGIADRLGRTAHPSYVRGFELAGMDRLRVPRIDAMNESLRAIGWGAVPVDGFIPPRAFQGFQAARLLPIAREVRRLEHLEYTPAPDILHEAAGHAPMLADPEYAEFARRIGELGGHAFRLPCDDESFEAIRELSIVKEAKDSTPAAIEAAEARVARAMRPDLPVSEAGRLARLYWWTIEYGLVGTPTDYYLYGAGLLSSLGESESCHGSDVAKVPLTAACVDTPYDITRPQPQLFVAPSFASLHAVLDAVMATTAYRRGGIHSVEVAVASEERAVIRFADGARIEGLFVSVDHVASRSGVVHAWGSLRATDRNGATTGFDAERVILEIDERGAVIDDGAMRVSLDDSGGGIVSCHPALD